MADEDDRARLLPTSCRVAATSPASDTVGCCATLTLYPSFVRML
jgi:hypothetical protein